jgi:hypothetical protein
VIERVINKWWDYRSPDLPLWKGKPITAYRLTKLMGQADHKCNEQTHRKYARLWLLYRRFFQARPAFSPEDLAFLKRVDRSAYAAASQLVRKQAH